MRGGVGVASDNRQDSNSLRLGASAEGRLAWPKLPSPCGHLCKPTRPAEPRVAFRRAPGRPTPLTRKKEITMTKSRHKDTDAGTVTDTDAGTATATDADAGAVADTDTDAGTATATATDPDAVRAGA